MAAPVSAAEAAATTAVKYLSRPCWEILHPKHQTCPSHLAISFADVFLRGVKMYGPLYLILALAKKRRLDLQILKSTTNAVVRTSTFVSLLGPGSLVITCLSYHLFKTHNRFAYFVAGAVPGFLAVLVERKERRREITIFMISVVIEQVWRMGVARKLVSPIKYGEVLLFSLVMGVMNYLFTFERDCMGNSDTPMSLIVGDKNDPDRAEALLSRWIGIKSKGSELTHIALGTLKGFLLGFSVRAGQWLLGFILRGGRPTKGAGHGILDLFKQAARIGSFLGLLVGGTRTIQLLAKLFNINKRVAGFLSGAIAGASSVLYPSVEISLYIIAKACEVLVNVGNKYQVIPWPLNSRHFEKFFFAAEIGMGFYGVCFENPTMRRSFWNFLLGLSGGRLDLLPTLTQMGSKELGYPLPHAHSH